MNPRYVTRQLGLLLLVLSLAMGLTTAAEAVFMAGGGNAERLSMLALLIGTLVSAFVGGTLRYLGRGSQVQVYFNRRDAMLLVAMGWMVGAALAAMPFYIWAQIGGPPPPISHLVTGHVFESYVACYFEAMSGLTTTGASVLGAAPFDVESLPKGLLLWRALTHWLGGLGIVVLFVAVLPLVGVGGKKLYQAEAPGPTKVGVRPRIRETARTLWLIYLALTFALAGAYRLAGMTWFHSICHAFSTIATGGLSTHNDSIGHYYAAYPLIDLITIVFMVLAGINFGLYYQLVNRNFTRIYKDPELRLYLGIIAVATALITAWTLGDRVWVTTGEPIDPGLLGAVRNALFQATAIQTTTGYSTIDYDRWDFFPKAVLVLVMFIGGCAGSTSGGLKVVRVLIAFKVIIGEFERIYRPQIVKPVRVGGSVVDPDVCRSVLIYCLLIVVLFAAGSIGLMLLEPAGSIDFTSAATAAAATVTNVGPGLGMVGPMRDFGFFSGASLGLMSLLMVLGRLEVFSILVLLMPRFWADR